MFQLIPTRRQGPASRPPNPDRGRCAGRLRLRPLVTCLASALVLVLAACGGGSSDSADTDTVEAPTKTPAPAAPAT